MTNGTWGVILFPDLSRQPYQFTSRKKAAMFILAAKGDTFVLRDGTRKVADNPTLVQWNGEDWVEVAD